jgi:Leucine-rich repeat (LRR) protein
MHNNIQIAVELTIIWCTAALIELDLAHNNITTLPAEMGNLQKLMDIDISGNAIEVLPESLAEIRDLLQLKVRT